MSKLTIEEHGEWREMANMMQNVTVPLETFFPDRSRQGSGHIFGEVSKVYALRWKDVLDGIWHLVDKDGNYHNVVYNKDLDQPAIVLTRDHLVSLTHYDSVTFKVYLTRQKATCNSLDVPSSIYYFLKNKSWTHLHLEDVVKCRLVFNHWRKTLKIGAGWKHFCQTLSLTADMKIIF
ncbi:hypothetical protein GmHk_02G004080 [Glycine max]|nr:hypothetical protein GmHk_02G004080 [Glycine max]